MADIVDPYRPATGGVTDPFRPAARPKPSSITGTPPTAKRPERSIGQAVGDTLLGVGRGVVNLASSAAGVDDLISPRRHAERAVIGSSSALLRAAGNDVAATNVERAFAKTPDRQELLGRAGSAIDSAQSPALQESKRELAETEGFIASAKKTVTDPRLLGNFVAEQVPNLAFAGVGTGVAGTRAAVSAGSQALERALASGLSRAAANKIARDASAKAARQAGSRFAMGTNTYLETGAAANQAYLDALQQPDEVWRANPDYQQRVSAGEDPDYVKQSLARSVSARAGVIAAPISAIASRVSAPFEADVFTGRLARRPVAIAGGIAREAAEEGVQEGGSQLATNLGVRAVDRQRGALEGVPEAAGTGAALGGVIGGGLATGGALASRPAPRQDSGQAEQERVAPPPLPSSNTAPPPLPAVSRRPQPNMVAAGEIARAADPAARVVTAQPPRFADAAPGSIADSANFLPGQTSAAPRAAVASEAVEAQPEPQVAPQAPSAPVTQSPAEQPPSLAARADSGRRLSPLPWVDAETGEYREPTRDEVKLAIHERLNLAYANGTNVNKGKIAQSLGIARSEFDAAYSEVRKERKEGLTAPAPAAQPVDLEQRVRAEIQTNRQRIRGTDEATSSTQPAALDQAAEQAAGSTDTDAVPTAGRAAVADDVSRAQEPAADDARAAVRTPESVEAAPAEAAPTGTAAQTYDESPEILDSDITPPSGGPFTQRGAADIQASRVDGGRVFEVDGGFVVRTPQAASVDEIGSSVDSAPDQVDVPSEAVDEVAAPAAAADAVSETAAVADDADAGSPAKQASPSPSGATQPAVAPPGGSAASPSESSLGTSEVGTGPSAQATPSTSGKQPKVRTQAPAWEMGADEWMARERAQLREADAAADTRSRILTERIAYNKAALQQRMSKVDRTSIAQEIDSDEVELAALRSRPDADDPVHDITPERHVRIVERAGRRGEAVGAPTKKRNAPDATKQAKSGTEQPKNAADAPIYASEPLQNETEAANDAPPTAPATLKDAAHEAATSPKNDLPTPTDAQKEAGNYRKGHIRLNGHDISIENPAGSKRRPEWPALKNHYGYFRGTVGKDKDHVDVFMTDRADDTSLPVFVVDQVNKDGSFDEHKVVMGAATEEDARKTYLANYSKGWKGLGGIKEFTQEEFKAWIRDPQKTKRRVTRPPRPMPGRAPRRAAGQPVADTQPGSSAHFSKPDDTVQVVQASRLGTDAQSRWKEADSAYRRNLQGTTIEGPDGRVRFSNVGRTKALSIGRRDPLRMGVALKLGELAANARVYERAPARDGAPDVQYAYAAGAVEVEGKPYAVRMVYRVTAEQGGDAGFYTFEGFQIEEPGAIDRGRSSEEPLDSRGSPGSTFSVAELVQAFNPDGRAFARPPTDGSGTGLSFERALELKAELTKEWGDAAPAVVVVRDAEGFPDSARADPDYRRAEGFYDGRPTVWINAATITSERRFAEVLAHEAIGHFGVEQIVGKQEWGRIVDAIARLATSGDAGAATLSVLADVRKRYGDLDPSAYASEVIAVMAERGVRNNLVTRVVAAVRRFLRRLMPNTISWSENDLRALLGSAESFLRAGRSVQKRQQAVQAYAFSKDISVDARGERSITSGGEKFIERNGRYYLVNGTGQPKDFDSFEDAWQAAQRTGAEVLRDDPVDGEPQTFSVVVREDDVRVATAARRFFSKPATEVLDEIEAVQRGVHAEGVLARARQLLGDAVPKKLKDSTRPTWLGALTTRHLTELGADYFSDIKLYSDDLTKMQADRNTLQAEVETIAENARQWASKNQAEAQQLFRLMHEATLDGVDPAEAYKPLQFRWAGQLHDATDKNVREAVLGIKQQMRERSGDPKKDMLERIKSLNAMRKAEKRRAGMYGGMVARWNQLSPEAQQIYRDFRDTYSVRYDAVEEALHQRIHDLQGDGVPASNIKALTNQLREQFEDNRLQGVYFPAQRFGPFFVYATNSDGVPTMQMYENGNDLERAVKDLRGRGWTIGAQGRKSEVKSKDAPSGTFIADVIKQLRSNGVSEKTQDDIYQVFLEALPDLSMRKHQIHRKGVSGFDTDAVRAFAYNMHHGSHQLARLRYSHRLQMTLDKLRKDQDSARREPDADTRKILAGDAVIDELGRRHEWIMNPQDSQLTNIISSLGFTYYLGATPAAALVNLTQTALVTYPYLASRHGPIKAMNYLLAASRDAVRTLGNIQKTLTSDEERAAHAALMTSGALDKTQAHNLAGIAEGGMLGYNPAWAKAMEIIGWGFHKTEVINREASAMAAFRLARADGASFNDAVKAAHDAVFDTHFDYSNANRARFMQSGTAKVLLMFRQYSLNMTWALGRMTWLAMRGQTPEVKRIARRNLAGVLGMSALFSGALGLPMMGVAMGTLNALQATFGDDDEPWDAETEFRAFLADMLGPAGAALVAHGAANQVTGADIAGRVGLSELWVRDADRELEGRGLYYHLLEQAAGPMGGILKNVLVGKSLIDEGHSWRGVETMLPKGLKDIVKAGRYAVQGANTLRGDPLVEDLSLWEVLLQANGFSPSDVSAQYERNRALKNYEQHIIDRRQHLMNAFAMALRTGDTGTRQNLITQIQAFNRTNPELAITSASISRSIQSRARYSAKAESGIVVNPKLAARLNAAIGE